MAEILLAIGWGAAGFLLAVLLLAAVFVSSYQDIKTAMYKQYLKDRATEKEEKE